MPITEHIYKILQNDMTPMQAVESLFARELTAE
jgi:glycerol-3-phosphate dehydrogenase